MGNSASSHAQQRTGRPTDVKYEEKDRQKSSSPAPAPGQPHPSMRQKKRSLELPDFNRSTLTASAQSRGRQKTPPRSQAINIPKLAADAPPARRPHNNFSSSELIVPATHLPFPPNQQRGQPSGGGGAGAGAAAYGGGRGTRSRGAPQPMQSIYNDPSQPQVHQRAPSPPSPTPFVKEVVNSSIPIGLLEEIDAQLYNEAEEEETAPARAEDSALTEPAMVKITWQGGGKYVVLARAGDDDWNGRQHMEKETPTSNTWTTTIELLPGTHHIRFLVDDQWRVSDELPTAVDDQGSLANYVNVQPRTPPTQSTPLPPITPAQASHHQHQQPQSTPQARPHIPGQSFWSASSSVDDGVDDYRPSTQQNLHAQVTQARWTSILPPELTEAAREEEAYLTASAGQYDAVARSVHVSGFVPAPNIPPAPGMPRHLDRLILNTKVTLPSHSSGNSNTGSPARGGNNNLPGGIGSGQGGTGSSRDRSDRASSDRTKREGRDRRRREERETRREERELAKREQRRAEERERERRDRELQQQHGGHIGNWRDSGYANFPPAPPPSEDGTGIGLDEKPEQSPVRGGSGATGAGGGIEEEGEVPLQESSDATAITTPEPTSTPTPERETSAQNQPARAAPLPPLPTQNLSLPPSSQQTPQPQRPGPSPIIGEPRGPVSGSRAITLDMENMPSLTDDAAVLPVPSHVVLQHLCTSAIRNGVLAVATTTRYRKKYMTTVYYKPTAM